MTFISIIFCSTYLIVHYSCWCWIPVVVVDQLPTTVWSCSITITIYFSIPLSCSHVMLITALFSLSMITSVCIIRLLATHFVMLIYSVMLYHLSCIGLVMIVTFSSVKLSHLHLVANNVHFEILNLHSLSLNPLLCSLVILLLAIIP